MVPDELVMYPTLHSGRGQNASGTYDPETATLCDIGHQGLLLDKEFGADIYHNRARYLFAELGHFGGPDPGAGAGGPARVGRAGPAVGGGFIQRDPILSHGRIGSSSIVASSAPKQGTCPLSQILTGTRRSCSSGSCSGQSRPNRSLRATSLRYGNVASMHLPPVTNMVGRSPISQENWQAGPLESLGALIPPTDHEVTPAFWSGAQPDSDLPPHLQQYVDGMNLYQYVGGNPIIYLDPSGRGRVTNVLKKLTWGQLCRLAGCLAATKGIDLICDAYLDDQAWLECVCENMRDRLGFTILCFGYRTHLMNAFHCSDIGINP
jgi:hypothetical protein